jgi:DNA mismatch repair protein MSH4
LFFKAIKHIAVGMSLTFSFHSLRIKYKPSEDSLMIDLSTIQSLELIQNIQNAKSRDCLFGLLNETLTPMGARLLRSNILQPSTQSELLSRRYEAVDEFQSMEGMFFSTRQGSTYNLMIEAY